MGNLFPFRAYRYSTERVGSIGNVVTQPYDKITPEMREAYLRRHDMNIVRVIKNPNYQEAGNFLNRWIKEGVLVQDSSPCLYPYEQTFSFEGREYSRLGFVGLVSLRDSSFAVKGHEGVLRGPLEDRLNLIRCTESNEGLIFTLYDDPGQSVDSTLREAIGKQPPAAEVVDEYKAVHRLWLIDDPRAHATVNAALADQALYIADGHHRFQTSQLFCQECEDRGFRPGAVESFDKRMVALFNLRSPGLKILPTHRGIRNLSGFSTTALMEKLGRFFVATKQESWERLKESMAGQSDRVGLVLAGGKRIYLLELKAEASNDPEFLPGVGRPARELPVNILHEGILRPYLGIGPEELASQKYVDYFRSSEELLAGIRESRYDLGFFLNPTTVEQVRDSCEKGEKMPQKSTDFYPKLLTGLAIMKMAIARP